MTNKRRNRYENVKPVQKVELDNNHIAIRVVLFIVFLFLGVFFIGMGVKNLITVNAGLTEIKPSINYYTVLDNFNFYYNLGEGNTNSTKENKELNTIYKEAITQATNIFSSYVTDPAYQNISYINNHYNEDILIPSELYKAFDKLSRYNDRYIYYASVYDDYLALAQYSNEDEVSMFDPSISLVQKEFYEQLLVYIQDTNHINLELKGNDTINLHVSDEYKNFMLENNIDKAISLVFYESSFIIDYLYNEITSRGFYNGCIFSNDGLFRSLSSTSYMKFNITDYFDKEVYTACTIETLNNISIVSLRNYRIFDNDDYFEYSNGRIIGRFFNKECLNTNSVNNLVSYGYNKSCSEIMLSVYNNYMNGVLDKDVIDNLYQDKSINTIYIIDNVIYCKGNKSDITDIYEGSKIKYVLE